MKDDEKFMKTALSQARAARERDEVPVGAVVVRDGGVIARGFNQRETLQDPTAHAEMIAITAAAADRRSWRLHDCTLYVTLEPCTMCAGAIVQARMKRLVFGAKDPKAGAIETLYEICTDSRLNHRVEIGESVLSEECGMILQEFFAAQRAKGKK